MLTRQKCLVCDLYTLSVFLRLPPWLAAEAPAEACLLPDLPKTIGTVEVAVTCSSCGGDMTVTGLAADWRRDSTETYQYLLHLAIGLIKQREVQARAQRLLFRQHAHLTPSDATAIASAEVGNEVEAQCGAIAALCGSRLARMYLELFQQWRREQSQARWYPIASSFDGMWKQYIREYYQGQYHRSLSHALYTSRLMNLANRQQGMMARSSIGHCTVRYYAKSAYTHPMDRTSMVISLDTKTPPWSVIDTERIIHAQHLAEVKLVLTCEFGVPTDDEQHLWQPDFLPVWESSPPIRSSPFAFNPHTIIP